MRDWSRSHNDSPEIAAEAPVIKYLGSKRRLVPLIGDLAEATGAVTALDLFSGSTRVARALKARGLAVTAVDSAHYAATLAAGLVAPDRDAVDADELGRLIAELNGLPGRDGYVTETFCRSARFFQEHNGRRIDAIREGIEEYRDTPWYRILLSALLLAADRVDSTTGVQMAYLKKWSPRSHNDLHLTVPELLPGVGHALRSDARTAAVAVGHVDFAYLDPPYNQHRYDSNYHIWDTLVRWDEPEHYGVACKRSDLRDPARRSDFNSRRTFAAALQQTIGKTDADTVVVSYNDESWVDRHQIEGWLAEAGHPAQACLAIESPRYVGARIGVHGPDGRLVGRPGRLTNQEWLIIGTRVDLLPRMTRLADQHGGVVLPADAATLGAIR